MYPPENERLAERIARQGVVMSEFSFGTPPLPGNFPRRNRIISGLSRAVVVVEAAARSGSLITARLALEQGRDVYAVPGQAGAATAQGTNQLIRDGAKLVETADDILEEFGVLPAAVAVPEDAAVEQKDNGDDVRKRVLSLLSSEPLYIDEVIQKSAQPAAVVHRRLIELQLAGVVREIEGKRFVRVK
jgi:DNA processing protein